MLYQYRIHYPEAPLMYHLHVEIESEAGKTVTSALGDNFNLSGTYLDLVLSQRDFTIQKMMRSTAAKAAATHQTERSVMMAAISLK
jgi:hypothetical protein